MNPAIFPIRIPHSELATTVTSMLQEFESYILNVGCNLTRNQLGGSPWNHKSITTWKMI